MSGRNAGNAAALGALSKKRFAVAADRGDRKSVVSFAKKLALSYPILLDPDGDVRNRVCR